MAVKDLQEAESYSPAAGYDPFARGPFPAGVRTFQALDAERKRVFSCEVWYPATSQHAGHDLAPETQDVFTVPMREKPRRQAAVRDAAARPGSYPLILFSHYSGGHRRASTFLCTHLSSHGYVVAALDHSEVSAPELARPESETAEQKKARWNAVIASRVPDVRFLLESMLRGTAFESNPSVRLDHGRIGIAGHSFGAWTALAANDVEPSIRAVVALAPGGNSRPRPGVLPVKLAFKWGRDVPTLYLVAENDVPLPLAGMYEIFDRTPATKQMVILRRADHMHFIDNLEQEHEAFRTMPPMAPELAEMQKEMRPITELSSEEQAHLWVRGLTLCHMDAILKDDGDARRFLAGDIKAELARRGVDVLVHQP
jgi:dienelactone hydrolase